jgi:heme a synthase
MNYINRNTDNMYPRFVLALRVLLGMVIVLMALGASVRIMGAGLACPDWPLCFGKVIPDYHPGVWFEFVHRADAGLVALDFLFCAIFAFKTHNMPKGVKWGAFLGCIILPCIISMGAITVLHQVREVAVTAHLLLATALFGAVYWMLMSLQNKAQRPLEMFPSSLALFAWVLPIAVFFQIAIGGLVASTFAGSVCLDWPLCNGQWVPTLSGPIGLQVFHRFTAYAIAFVIFIFTLVIQKNSTAHWVTPQLLRVSRFLIFVVFLQILLGVLNLKFMIPPYLAVPHQTIALLLFATSLRLYFLVRRAHTVIK